MNTDDLYAWTRFDPTPNVNVETIYADKPSNTLEQNAIADLVLSKKNVDYLTNLIIERADPLRNGRSLLYGDYIRSRVVRLLQSWKNLGKFDKETIPFEGRTLSVLAVSPVALMDYYNLEFVEAFAEKIIPASDVLQVTSVVNPDGFFAQQERILKINSKPVPFYEKALYARLTDRNLQQRIDETEMPFYRMDPNPRISEQERKKADVDRNTLPTYFEREAPSFRMDPNYSTS